MEKVLSVLFVVLSLVFCPGAFAVTELQLPYDGGLTLNVTRGYNTPPTHLNKDVFALDFVGNGCDSWNSPILAVADGIVSKVHSTNDNAYGKHVEIDHGGGIISKSAHLNSISVLLGASVSKGQEIGRMGNTGNVKGSACPSHPGTHLHFVMYENGAAFKPEPMSGYSDFTAWQLYTSLNTFNPFNSYRVGKYADGYVLENTCDYRPFSRPFVVGYYHNLGSAMLGHPVNNVYLLENCYGCSGYGASKSYVQDFSGGQIPSSTLVMNMYVYNIRFNYLGVAYPIHGQIRDYWYLHYSELGAPVTNEYYWNDGGNQNTVQWFEPSDNRYIAVVYDAGQQSFRQCSSSIPGCPPLDQQVFDQHLFDNLGCPSGNCGVGGDGTEPTDYIFEKATTCKGIDTADSFLPVNETSEFYNTDTTAYAWLELDNVYKALNLNFKWYDANNTLVNDYTFATDDPAASGHDFWDWYRIYDDFNVSSSTSFGQWHVDIYVDGEKVTTNYFNLNVILEYPTNLAAGNITSSSVTLSWLPALNATSYKIYRNGQLVAETNQISYVDFGLTPVTAYTYYVVAVNGNYTSSPSASITATTLDPPPVAPTNLTIVSATSSGFNMIWAADN